VKILIETSGGGGVVLLIALALLMGHGGGIGAAVAVVVIALAVIVALAAAVLVTVLVRRALPERTAAKIPAVVRISAEPGELPSTPRALDAQVRLPQDQLEQLAEIIRRQQRPQ
jgi:hypothetical protein